MSRRLAFHINQNLNPERTLAILDWAINGLRDLDSLAEKCGLRPSVLTKVVLPAARAMELIGTHGVTSSTLGEQLYTISQGSPPLFAEAMHHVLYTAFHLNQSKRFSWAYAKIVDALWASGGLSLEPNNKARIVAAVIEEASNAFGVSSEQIAFSRDSVAGAMNWLRTLDPPVVDRQGSVEVFRRRFYCPAVVFLWGLSALYGSTDTNYGVRLFLTPERLDQLCRICVLDRSGLDNVLMMAKRTSDHQRGGLFDYGTEGGFGRWVLMAERFSPAQVEQ